MTRQEMFEKAVRGLASQGWTRCMTPDNVGCSYSNGSKHCAWGWVDTGLGDQLGTVNSLRNREVPGLHMQLDKGQLKFAEILQDAHDGGFNPQGMLDSFISIHHQFNLNWPADVKMALP